MMKNEGRLSKDIVSKLSNREKVLAALKGGQGGQAFFGYSDELMETFYKKAHRILEEGKTNEAVDSFVFLVTLNAFHSEYWMGLGAALQMAHDYEAAIDAYEIAAIYNIEHPLPYLYLAKCLFAIHDRKSALQSLELAIAYAGDIEEYESIRIEAENARDSLQKLLD